MTLTIRGLSSLLCLFVAGAFAFVQAPGGHASPTMRAGIMDDAQTLSDDRDRVDRAFTAYQLLGIDVVRVMLRWDRVAGTAPTEPANNSNSYPLEKWAPYDEAVRRAARSIPQIDVLFDIYGTPGWANGGRSYHYAPTGKALKAFAFAAAKRYDGSFPDPLNAGEPLPRVKLWAAGNEPNLPTFLRPQWKKVGARWVSTAPRLYAGICNQIVDGVHAAQSMLTGEVVACGLTSPRGGGKPGGKSSSHTPLAFLRGMKKYKAHFDVYAHHPHSLKHSPTWVPPRGSSWIPMSRIGVLTKELTRLYGAKKLWITEFGYETKPPDPLLGVTYAQQAQWLSKAYTIARKNPRVSMFIWFLLRDEEDRNGPGFGAPGWQSGLFPADTALPAKRAFTTFQNLLN